jgi:hypothetical protein
VLEFVVAWAFALGGLSMAVVCALNCLGLARGWMRNDAGLIGNLGLGMVSAGLAGFVWAIPATDGPVEAWRFYWMLLGGVGLVLMVGSAASSDETVGFRRWVRQGARIHTSRSEWRPKHFLVLGTVAAWAIVLGFVPSDAWWFWVVWIPFLAFTGNLRTLPIHFGRRPPNPLGPVTEP